MLAGQRISDCRRDAAGADKGMEVSISCEKEMLRAKLVDGKVMAAARYDMVLRTLLNTGKLQEEESRVVIVAKS